MSFDYEQHGITEQQLAEAIFVASQAKVLNTIARLASRNPKEAYKSLQEILPTGTIHPDLHGLEQAILFVIGSLNKSENLRCDEISEESKRNLAAIERRAGFRLVAGGAT